MALLCRKNVTILLFVCTAFVLIGSNNFGVEADKEIPAVKKFGQQQQGTMTFLYCYSCGYRKAFEDYVNIISEKFPEIIVTGANYDPPGLNMFISKIIFTLKIILIVAIASSFDVFGRMGRETPAWYMRIKENKIYVCMMIFFVGNMLEGQLVASGAFEITLNGIPVWSKLETGRIPAPQELFQIIDSQMNLVKGSVENPDFVK